MAKEVILTPIALDDFQNVVAYLISEWGISVANNFIERFEQITFLLSENAGMFPFFDESRQMQKCVLTKHNIIYFKETVNSIKILTIFDTRQNPENLTLIF
jgi:plasmid stabilization system protein ParE